MYFLALSLRLLTLQAEIAEERFMMRRTKEENVCLHQYFLRSKHHLGDLQAVQPDLPDSAQKVISEMHGLASETDKLVSSYRSLWDTYSSLPGTPRSSQN